MNVGVEPLRLWACGRSDPGRVREANEDAFYVSEEKGLFIVSDQCSPQDGYYINVLGQKFS